MKNNARIMLLIGAIIIIITGIIRIINYFTRYTTSDYLELSFIYLLIGLIIILIIRK
mgnify:CR=1 FL=1